MIDNVMTAAQASVMAFFYGDINIYGSALTAAPTGRIEVTAGRALNLYAIENLDESSSDVKKKSSFLGIRYNKNHTNDTRQELTQLPTTLIGNKAYTKSGGSTLLQGTVFDTLNPDDIQVGVGKYADAKAQIILDTITTRITATHNQEKESTVWQKTVDKGDVVTTGTLPKFNQTPTMTSPNGVVIVVPVDVTVSGNNQAKLDIQKSPEELGKIALNLSKQPGYEYLAALDKTNNINWAQVDLIQKNWNYTQEGLTPGAAALIAIAITIAAGPAGSGLSASMVATNAAGIALQTQAVITLINNKGDISKTLKDMASSDTIRNMATAALTAGLGAKLNLPQIANNDFANKLVNGIAEGATGAFVNAAINGVSLEDALKNSLRSSLVDVFSAEIYSGFVKDFDTNEFSDNLAHKLVAAGVGCISASAKKQSCDAGAIGAAVGEMLGDYLVSNPRLLTDKQKADILNTTKLVAGSVALLVNVDVNVAASSAGVAVENNTLKHEDVYELLKDLARARRSGNELDVYNATKELSAEAVALAAENWKDFQSCANKPTAACYSKLQKDYANVNYKPLIDAVGRYTSIYDVFTAMKGRAAVLTSCNTSPISCLEQANANGFAASMVLSGPLGGVAGRSGYYTAGRSGNKNAKPYSPLQVPETVTAKNGLNYTSNGKHNPGAVGYNRAAGTEPKNSLDLFENSVPIGGQRMAFDNNGALHRYTDNKTAEGWHWAGASSDKSIPFKPNGLQKADLKRAFPSQKRNPILK